MDRIGQASAFRVTDAADLRRFLQWYRCELLVPLELPTICRAWAHAVRNEARELVALDRELAARPALAEFAAASRRAGRERLRCLRPLRDQRLVRRYAAAVEAGEANGWHTLVYGVTLAIYSVPLRQGLLHYAGQTLDGFVDGAQGRLRLPAAEVARLSAEAAEGLPAAVEALIGELGLTGGLPVRTGR